MIYYVTTYNEAISIRNNINAEIIASGRWNGTITNNLCDIVKLKNNKGALPIVEGYEDYYATEQIAEGRELTEEEQLGFWHEQDLDIQIFIHHTDNARFLKEHPSFAVYCQENEIISHIEEEGVYIYVNELFDEHSIVLEMFNAKINEN